MYLGLSHEHVASGYGLFSMVKKSGQSQALKFLPNVEETLGLSVQT